MQNAEGRNVDPTGDQKPKTCFPILPSAFILPPLFRLQRKYSCSFIYRMLILPFQNCWKVNMHRKTCHFSGRVQGVGFRYTAQNIAQQYNVKGYVKNLPDGRVELVLEGCDEDMDQIVECIRERLDSFIGRVDFNQLPATGEFPRFQIRH
jgi:acylphosphatase